MKKAFWLLAAAIPVLLVACGGGEKASAPQADALVTVPIDSPTPSAVTLFIVTLIGFLPAGFALFTLSAAIGPKVLTVPLSITTT